jgi:hypothetical protein
MGTIGGTPGDRQPDATPTPVILSAAKDLAVSRSATGAVSVGTTAGSFAVAQDDGVDQAACAVLRPAISFVTRWPLSTAPFMKPL